MEEQESFAYFWTRLPKLRIGGGRERAIRSLALSAGRRPDLPLPTFGLSVREAIEHLCHGTALSCISLSPLSCSSLSAICR